MYVDENNDSLPYPNYDGGASATAPQGWLYSMNAATLPAGAPAGAVPNPYDVAYWKSNPLAASQSGLFFKFMASPKAYLCPVDISSPTFTTPTASGGRKNKLSTYLMNGAVNAYGAGTPCKSGVVWSPLCYIAWEPNENQGGQGVPGAAQYNDGSNDPRLANEGIGLLHSKTSGNAVALDGHAEFVTASLFTQYDTLGSGPGPGGKTYLIWNPLTTQGN